MQTPAPLGIGVDIVKVSRFDKHLENKLFLERLFTPVELADAGDGPNLASRLAARWAAKEAAAKALGCGFGGKLGWREVEIIRGDNGKPHLKLDPEADRRHGHPHLSLSISHDGDYAIAFVVCAGNSDR